MVCCRPGTSYLGRCTRNKITEVSSLRQILARGFDSPLYLLIYSWSETRKVLQPIWFIYLPTVGVFFGCEGTLGKVFAGRDLSQRIEAKVEVVSTFAKAFIKFLLPTFPSHNSSEQKSILLMLMSQWPLSPSFASARTKRSSQSLFISRPVFSPLESPFRPAQCV